LISVPKISFRRGAATLAMAIALSGSVGINRASADVTYTSYTWTGDVVEITGPGEDITGGSGQIQLHLNTGSTILAWCLDIYDWLQPSGTYSVTKNGPIYDAATKTNISASTAANIGGLMVEGNALIKADKSLTLHEWNQTYTFSVADESAATQIAIWSTEYGSSFHYNTSKMPTGFADLVTYIETHAGTATYYTLDPDPANCVSGQTKNCTSPTNQHLGFVPGPIVGAGFPGLVAACAALIALARRRRQAAA
jgi:hypothetical protein